jgi:hypothetical protein
MPSQDRFGLHEEAGPTVTAEHARDGREDRSVVVFEAGTRDLALQDGELMAQHEDLDVLGPVTATSQHQQVDHEPDETEETGHAVILIDAQRANQTEARNPRSWTRTSIRHPQGTFVRVQPTKPGTFDCNPKYVITRKLNLFSGT